MKKILFFLFLLPFLANGQISIDPAKIVSDTTTYTYSAEDTSWIETRTVEYYSGIGELINTATFTNQIGDTSFVKDAILNSIFSEQLQQARSLKASFFNKRSDRIYSESRSVYEAITGESLERGMSQKNIGTYAPSAKFRIVCDTTDFNATLIEIPSGPNEGRLRLDRDDNSDLWLFNPKSSENFELQNMRVYFQSGGVGPIHFALFQENERVKIYRPKDHVAGPRATNTCLNTLRVIQFK